MGVVVLEDIGFFVWYSHTIAAFKSKDFISLNAIPSDKDLKILANPDTSMMICLVHHSLGTLFYHGDKIYSPWHKPIWGPDIPSEYTETNKLGGLLWSYGAPYPRRGRNAMPLPTKRAVFGFIDQALAGPSNV